MKKGIGITIERQTGRQFPADTRGALPPDPARARSLYIHVPFCFHKCHYCDFYSFVDSRDQQDAYADALCDELRVLAQHAERERAGLETVFVGGGTPTLLRADLWRKVLETLAAEFDLGDPSLEFTVECNPETASAELFDVLVSGGVNRISIGAQSFDERHLKTLERWHDPASVEQALRLAEGAGIARRSIDLIFAIPGQTPDDWEADLRRAIAFGQLIDHISCYALTYEPGTAMTARRDRGEFAPGDEDAEADMYLATVAALNAAGFQRYEVSNFARPGAECRHNLAYWRQDQWLAAGPSASAHIAGARWKNVPRLGDWMAGVRKSGGYPPLVDYEGPEPGRALAERIMTGLRVREGLELESLRRGAERIGSLGSLDDAICAQRQRGMITERDGRIALEDKAYLFADGVAGELMRSL